MMLVDGVYNVATGSAAWATGKQRTFIEGDEAGVLGDIYRDDVNMVVWQRELPNAVQQDVDWLFANRPGFNLTMTVTPKDVQARLDEAFGVDTDTALSRDITEVVDMFCYLFDLPRAGLRLAELTTAMCPKFHVDRVPCRLITTYRNVATEWLPHGAVDRTSLGSSERSVAFVPRAIRQLRSGDIALLKGEAWVGNADAGLVHRSPALLPGSKRLLLTVDFSR
ncbi:MAG: DUF1826 domain-containing protein [Pseudomonadota bacterium]